MRLYAASPLHSYAELIFRSRRLFIVCVLVATLATVLLYVYKSGSYTATSLVLLSGRQIGTSPTDKDIAGSVAYKLSILDILLRDPNFIADSMRTANLGAGLSPTAFRSYCQDVRNSLSYDTEGNALEITCHWHNPLAAAIINAFFSGYKSQVAQYETIDSVQKEQTLQDLERQYAAKQAAIEQRVASLQEAHALDLPIPPDAASEQYQQQLAQVERYKLSAELENIRMATLRGELKNTKPEITAETIRAGLGENPDYLAAIKRQQDAAANLASLRQKYFDTAPKVQAALAQLNLANADVKRITAAASGKNAGPIEKTEEAINPAYLNLQQQIQQQQLDQKRVLGELAQAEAQLQTARSQATTAPGAQLDYQLMTADLSTIQGIHQSLRAQLEQARINEQQDRARSLVEMQMLVPPLAEPDRTPAKTALLLACGPLLGLLIAFGFSLLAESLDHSLRTPVDVEKYLGRPVLAVLPNIETTRKQRRSIGSDPQRQSLPW